MTSEWWLKPGETIWSGLNGWHARFLWDDGQGTWGLCVMALHEDRQVANAWWRYDLHHLDVKVDESFHDALTSSLGPLLRDSSPAPQLSSQEDAILSTVIAESLKAEDRRATGKEVRFLHRPTSPSVVNRALDALGPRFVSKARNAWGEESYRATLTGLLYVRKEETEAALVSLIDALSRLYHTSRRVRQYSAEEVSASSLPLGFLGEVVHASTLHDGWGPEHWRVPADIEDIANLRSVADFLRHARESTAVAREWPSAPTRGVPPTTIADDDRSTSPRSFSPSETAQDESNMAQLTPPVVFISYSHDSEPHKDWVRQLAHDLRHKGVDPTLDQWDLGLGDDIAAFMERLEKADRVLLICSTSYVEKANAGKGPLCQRSCRLSRAA